MLSSLQIIFGQTENPFTKGNLLSGGSFSFDFDQIKDYEPVSGTNPQQITTTIHGDLNNTAQFVQDYVGFLP